MLFMISISWSLVIGAKGNMEMMYDVVPVPEPEIGERRKSVKLFGCRRPPTGLFDEDASNTIDIQHFEIGGIVFNYCFQLFYGGGC